MCKVRVFDRLNISYVFQELYANTLTNAQIVKTEI